MRQTIYFFICMFLFFLPGNASYAKLREILLKNYDSNTLPTNNTSDTIYVDVRNNLIQLVNVDILRQKLTVSLWLELSWIDRFLQWNKTDFPIETLSLPLTDVWKPDISFYNALKKLEHTVEHERVAVTPAGVIMVAYSLVAEVPCKMDVRRFPFDSQNCSIRLGSWTYPANLLSLSKSNFNVNRYYYTENSEWELERSYGKFRSTVYNGNVSYEDISYFFILKRKSMYYLWNLVLPCITLLCIGIGTHLLDAKAERLDVMMTTLLAFTVFLLMIPDILPPQSDSVSRIAFFFGFSVLLLGFSTISTMITIYIIDQSDLGTELRPCQRVVLQIICKISSCLCLKGERDMLQQTKRVTHGEEVSEQDRWEKSEKNEDSAAHMGFKSSEASEKALAKLEWMMLASGFDRLTWILFAAGCVTNIFILFY